VLGLVERAAYAAEVHDCDDFAFGLKGAAGHGVGVATNLLHVWNVVLSENGVWQVEPQNGRLVNRWALGVML